MSFCKRHHTEAFLRPQVQEGDELARRKSREATLLVQQQRDFQKELRDTKAVAEGHESASAIFRQKYRAAMEKVQLLEGQTASLEEEVRYSKVQVSNPASTLVIVQC